jgi:hypothetical protein
MINARSISNLRPPWQPGTSGNPGGKPTGARNKVTANFLRDLVDLWERRGKEILDKAADKDPVGVMRAILQLIPKQVEATGLFDDMGSDRMQKLIAVLDLALQQDEPAA